MAFSSTLPLPKQTIQRCRSIGKEISSQVADLVHHHSTVGIERSVLRLLGMNGAMAKDGLLYPVANQLIDELGDSGKLSRGALYAIANACLHFKLTPKELDQKLASETLNLNEMADLEPKKVREMAKRLATESVSNLRSFRKKRAAIQTKLTAKTKTTTPLKYVIVATGNIFEDVTQARSAVLDGADIIAVIRSTAQSLLDYVPHGNTTEGFGGTYATQANFHVMREALDAVGQEVGRYIRLTNYCSGLCMSEIAALAAVEGLDCLLNDAMYGILFRDINMKRTLIDQHFSRTICGFSNIWIMTGEDNYMKTTDAVESGDQVLASQFINEATALNAGMKPHQMAIGHAMEMNPDYPQVILWEIARALMTRQIFPDSPLKYMCNTKYKTGDIFTSHAIDTVLNFIGSLTNQGMILLGMPTEAVHTPFLADRSLSIRNANYILGGSQGLSAEIGYRSDGEMATFALDVLKRAQKLLEGIHRVGIMKAIEKRTFANVCRTPTGGKGADGVFAINPKEYFNPFASMMGSRI